MRDAELSPMDAFFPMSTAGALASVAPRHAFSTRHLSFRGEASTHDWAQLALHLQTSEPAIVRASQVHGRRVLTVSSSSPPAPAAAEADAIVCTDPAKAVAVRVADCVPILIADRAHRVVAAVHAGWRGSCAGVTTATIEAIEELGIAPDSLVAAIGPSMGGCCYQVDDRVRTTFLGMTPDAAGWFAEDGPGHWKLDLWQANRDQLEAAGVPAASIHVMGVCTRHNHDQCWSYRVDGPGAGRMVAAIRL